MSRFSGSNGARGVLRGDRLISANGKQGSDQMGAEFKADPLVLRFERWIDLAGTTVTNGAGGNLVGDVEVILASHLHPAYLGPETKSRAQTAFQLLIVLLIDSC